MPPARLAAIGKAVKAERKKLDMSSSAFCDHVGISRTTLRALERGQNQLTQATIEKLAKVMRITSEALTGIKRIEPDPLTKELKSEDLRLANQFHHAGADVKYAAKGFLGSQLSDEHRDRIALVLVLLMRGKDDLLTAVEELLKAYEAQQREPVAPMAGPAATTHEQQHAPGKRTRVK